MDSRIVKLAEIIVQHSCRLEPGERVLIEAFDLPSPDLVTELVRQAREAGAIPLVQLRNNQILKEWVQTADESTLEVAAQIDAARMREMQAYIGIRASENSADFSDVAEAALERVPADLHEAGSFRDSCSAHQMVRHAIPDAFDGPIGEYEHLGLHRLLLPRLHHRLCPHGGSSEAIAATPGTDRACPHRQPGD